MADGGFMGEVATELLTSLGASVGRRLWRATRGSAYERALESVAHDALVTAVRESSQDANVDEDLLATHFLSLIQRRDVPLESVFELAADQGEALATLLDELIDPLSIEPPLDGTSFRTVLRRALWESFFECVSHEGSMAALGVAMLERQLRGAPALPRRNKTALLALGEPPDTGLLGREALLRNALDALNGTAMVSPTTVALHGLAGVGKTAVARELVRLVASDHAESPIELRLRTYFGVAVSTEELLTRMLAHLGLPAVGDVTELMRRWRDATSSMPLLLLLDDAIAGEQIQAVLPAGPSVVVATSRAPLAFRADFSIEVERLDIEASLELLSRLIGQERIDKERAHAERIAAHCNRLPLALRAAGARLRSRRHWSLEYYADQLEPRPTRLQRLALPDASRGLQTVIHSTVEKLDSSARHLFALLGLLDVTSVSVYYGEVLLGKRASGTELDRIADDGLLEPSVDGLYDLPEVFWAGARELLEATTDTPERERLFHRLIDVFSERAALEASAMEPTTLGDDTAGRRSQALRWFSNNESVLLALLRDERAIKFSELRAGLAVACAPYLDGRARWQEVRDLLSELSWDRTISPSARSNALNQLGLAIFRLGDMSAAAEVLSEALVATESDGDEALLGRILNNLGSVYNAVGDYDLARKYLERALAVRTAIADGLGCGRVLGNLGNVHRNLGHLEEAESLFRQAESQLERAGDRHNLSTAYNNWAIVLGDMHRLDDAEAMYGNSLRIARDVRSVADEARARHNLACLYIKTGRFSEAERELATAMTLEEPTGSRSSVAYIWHSLGQLRAVQGRPSESVPLFEQAAEVRAVTRERPALVRSLVELASSLTQVREWKRAADVLRDAQEVADRLSTR
jgi:tetratricopeptide (TPR) repeat protein